MSTQESTPKTIVVFGATGNIGTPFVQALSERNTNPASPAYNILALSRDPTSSASQRLARLPGVTVVKVPANNMDEPLAALASADVEKGDVYGVFSVQGYVSYAKDIAQGKAIADAAVSLGAQHLVYLSTDFGGVPDTGASPFERKRVVENYIRTLPIAFTFLRPAQFMDNLLPTSTSFMRLARTMLIHNTFKTHPERQHMMVSARDIGRAGALAFDQPEKWRNREFPLAGDKFTIPELRETYRQVMGMEVDTGNSWITGFARAVVPEPKGLADFFDKIGYSIDIEECRRELPGLQNLREFLEDFKAQLAQQ